MSDSHLRSGYASCVAAHLSVVASIIADPTETTDLAAKLPDVLERLKQRHTQLMETALPQARIVWWNAHVWSWVQAPPEYIAALRRNRGFVGPWLNEG